MARRWPSPSSTTTSAASSPAGIRPSICPSPPNRPLHYRFVANITDGSFSFSSGLSSGGTAIVDASGRNIPDLFQGSIMEGTIPHDENGFGTFIQEGDLPAGQYRLFAGATSIIESRGRDAISAQGRVQFTLQAEEGPTPNPVPLPPGAWPALGTMAAAAGAGLVRRRRRQVG
jgi:hypothetical protein